MSCIFCKIVEGQIPSKKVYEDDHVLAIEDVAPCAPVHILVMPKKHLATILEVNDPVLSHKLISACQHVAQTLKIDQSGFRIVTNTGSDGGQTVSHLHIHLVGGRAFHWPPG